MKATKVDKDLCIGGVGRWGWGMRRRRCGEEEGRAERKRTPHPKLKGGYWETEPTIQIICLIKLKGEG